MTHLRRHSLGWILPLLALLLAPRPALAQFSGGLQGTVTDAQKAVVADAIVMVTNTQSGVSREAYAFDARARMLSESRFIDALVAAGLLRAGDSAILKVRLVDPAGAGSGEQLTRLVAAALAARTRPRTSAEPPDSVLLTPYHNYLGEPVVGAWRWLDDAGFGIAV